MQNHKKLCRCISVGFIAFGICGLAMSCKKKNSGKKVKVIKKLRKAVCNVSDALGM